MYPRTKLYSWITSWIKNSFMNIWPISIINTHHTFNQFQGELKSLISYHFVLFYRIMKNETCWSLLNRWISSTNRTVILLNNRNSFLATLMTSLTSAMPDVVADKVTKRMLFFALHLSATVLAKVVCKRKKSVRFKILCKKNLVKNNNTMSWTYFSTSWRAPYNHWRHFVTLKEVK